MASAAVEVPVEVPLVSAPACSVSETSSAPAVGSQPEGPRHVKTTINYYRDDGNAHTSSIAGKRSTFNQPSVDFDVVVTDISGSEDKYTLDSHGFQLLHHVSAEKDFTDEDKIKEVYYPEIHKLVLDL